MDVIRCDQSEYLVWKWRPDAAEGINATAKENAVRYGSSLRVKDGEAAVFVYQQKDGTLQDFIEGPYDGTLKSANFPVLARLAGAAFGGASPFQAEIYFINTAGINQISFGVPYFDVFDPRFPDFAVPVAVRGKLTFRLADYRAFIKLHRLVNFSPDDLGKQIKSAVSKYVKAVVSNAPGDYGIPALQLERKILRINEIVENHIKPRMESEFGIAVSSVDIDTIEAAQDSEGYQKLMELTRDITVQTTQARAGMNIENMQESLRIQREEAQRAQKLRTEGANIAVHQLNQQTDVAKTAAASLGQMGQGASAGSGGGFNPGAMMAGAAMGGMAGQQMAGMIGNMMQGMNQPPPVAQYNVAVNGQTAGPFTLEQLARMVQDGRLTDKSMVWKAGMAGWAAAGTVQELASLFIQVPPPPPV